MIGEHESAHPMRSLDVRRFPRERHLDTGGTPRDELRELTFADTLQALVDLRTRREGTA